MVRRTLLTLSAVLPAAIVSFVAACQSPAQAGTPTATIGPPGTSMDQAPAYLMLAQSVAPSTTISIDDDPYHQGIFYRSEASVVRSQDASLRWRLVGRKLRRYEIKTYYLEVQIEYRAVSWILFDLAVSDQGESLGLVPWSRETLSCAGGIGRCNYLEAFDVGLREEQMRRGAAAGLGVRLMARSGQTAKITVPPSLIRALLAEME